MCRRKPGPRCPSCQHRALKSITGRLETLASKLQETAPGVTRTRMEGEARELARQIACRRADLYATSAYQRDTRSELEQMLADNPDDPRASKRAMSLVEGRIMDRYRREQAALMPPRPDNNAALAHHHDLGSARFDMAHARLRMDMSRGDTAEWQEWQQRHHNASQQAALAQARMDAANESGPNGWSSLTAGQQRRRRDAIAEAPSFATPVAPRRWQDVVDESQDVVDGITPVRERVDTVGVAPFGDPGYVSSDDKPEPDPVDDNTPAGKAGEAPAGTGSQGRARPTGRADALKKQARRRSKRRRSATATLKSLRADGRKAKQKIQQVESNLDDLMPSTKVDGEVFDLTFLSLIAESAGGRR